MFSMNLEGKLLFRNTYQFAEAGAVMQHVIKS